MMGLMKFIFGDYNIPEESDDKSSFKYDEEKQTGEVEVMCGQGMYLGYGIEMYKKYQDAQEKRLRDISVDSRITILGLEGLVEELDHVISDEFLKENNLKEYPGMTRNVIYDTILEYMNSKYDKHVFDHEFKYEKK